jgi:hypothetical protein
MLESVTAVAALGLVGCILALLANQEEDEALLGLIAGNWERLRRGR